MSIQPDPQLEVALHEQLRKLPDQPAPATLVPRVRKALAARAEQAWWQQPWLAWPRAWQTTSATVFLALIGLVGWLAPLAWEQAENVAALQPVTTGLGSVLAMRAAMGSLLFASPWWGASVLLSVAAVYLVCIGLGTACLRVAVHQPETK